MRKIIFLGEALRAQAKSLVIEFMESHPQCAPNSVGMKQSEIFRGCGLVWGEKEKATSTNQQYWVVALLRELSEVQLVEQVRSSGPWRLRG